MILFNFGVYFISFVLYTVHKFNIIVNWTHLQVSVSPDIRKKLKDS